MCPTQLVIYDDDFITITRHIAIAEYLPQVSPLDFVCALVVCCPQILSLDSCGIKFLKVRQLIFQRRRIQTIMFLLLHRRYIMESRPFSLRLYTYFSTFICYDDTFVNCLLLRARWRFGLRMICGMKLLDIGWQSLLLKIALIYC